MAPIKRRSFLQPWRRRMPDLAATHSARGHAPKKNQPDFNRLLPTPRKPTRLRAQRRCATHESMSIVVYQYPNCSTCKKALRLLGKADVDFKSKDIVVSPPPKALLAKALRLSGLPLKKLFNTAGKSYREGGFKDKLPTMSDEQALTALANDGKLIKRPLVLGDGFALVGFRESEWREALGI